MFDGHGQDGEKVSNFVKKVLPAIIEDESMRAFKPQHKGIWDDFISLAETE